MKILLVIHIMLVLVFGFLLFQEIGYSFDMDLQTGHFVCSKVR